MRKILDVSASSVDDQFGGERIGPETYDISSKKFVLVSLAVSLTTFGTKLAEKQLMNL